MEFKINNHLSLRLEKNLDPKVKGFKTNIYVGGKYFRQCKSLLLNIPVKKVISLDEIESIDEVAEKLGKSQRLVEEYIQEIPPEVEFWGHCSNLQVWYENNYDTCLLHSNLAFPLVKILAEVGDPQAKRIFKEEIFKRVNQGYMPVIEYLMLDNYFQYLNHEELITALLEPQEANAILELEKIMSVEFEVTLTDPTYIFEINKPNIVINNKQVIGFKVYNCDIEKIKNNIKILTRIRYLELKFEKSENFPDFILSFSDLEHLLIDGLEIEQIPEEICNLKSIYSLYFCESKIKKLPDCLKNLENLKIIDINYNNLDKKSRELIETINKKIKN